MSSTYYIIFGKEPIVNARLHKWYCIKSESKYEAELVLQEILNCPKKVYDDNHNGHIYNDTYFIYYSDFRNMTITKDDFALVDIGINEFCNHVNNNKLVIMNE